MIKQRTSQRGVRQTACGIAVVCALVIAVTFGLTARAQCFSNVTVSSSSAARVLVGIEGMHCTTCANGIKAMLKRTPGVISAEVSYERREVDVEYDPSRTSPEKIVEAINNLGYKASVKEQKDA